MAVTIITATPIDKTKEPIKFLSFYDDDDSAFSAFHLELIQQQKELTNAKIDWTEGKGSIAINGEAYELYMEYVDEDWFI